MKIKMLNTLISSAASGNSFLDIKMDPDYKNHIYKIIDTDDIIDNDFKTNNIECFMKEICKYVYNKKEQLVDKIGKKKYYFVLIDVDAWIGKYITEFTENFKELEKQKPGGKWISKSKSIRDNFKYLKIMPSIIFLVPIWNKERNKILGVTILNNYELLYTYKNNQ